MNIGREFGFSASFDVCGILWVLPCMLYFQSFSGEFNSGWETSREFSNMRETSIHQADNTSFTCPDEDGAFGHCCLPAECPSGASPADCEFQSTGLTGRRKSVAYVTAGPRRKLENMVDMVGLVTGDIAISHVFEKQQHCLYDILDPFLRIGWIDDII